MERFPDDSGYIHIGCVSQARDMCATSKGVFCTHLAIILPLGDDDVIYGVLFTASLALVLTES